jgi:hypothetical protein
MVDTSSSFSGSVITQEQRDGMTTENPLRKESKLASPAYRVDVILLY